MNFATLIRMTQINHIAITYTRTTAVEVKVDAIAFLTPLRACRFFYRV